MAWKGSSVLAVVPARGGSKGIPRKNLCKVGGLSLIAHVARIVAALPWIDRAILSTDDEEIAEEGRLHGIEVPFMRPESLATDTATGEDVWRHAWLETERHYGGDPFAVSVLLQPTTPFRRAQEVEQTVKTLLEGGHRSAATVGRVPPDFAPQRCLTLRPDGLLSFYRPEGGQVARRQECETLYYRDGTCYAATREFLVEAEPLIGENCVAVPIDRYVINIDEPLDLELAEFVHSRGGEL